MRSEKELLLAHVVNLCMITPSEYSENKETKEKIDTIINNIIELRAKND